MLSRLSQRAAASRLVVTKGCHTHRPRVGEFARAAINGDHKTMRELVGRGDAPRMSEYLYWAAAHGRYSIISQILAGPSRDLNAGLRGACEAGDWGSIWMMIGRGADDWNMGLEVACRKGHDSVARMMVDLGATNLDGALSAACEAGHSDIVRFIVGRGAKVCAACGHSAAYHLEDDPW